MCQYIVHWRVSANAFRRSVSGCIPFANEGVRPTRAGWACPSGCICRWASNPGSFRSATPGAMGWSKSSTFIGDSGFCATRRWARCRAAARKPALRTTPQHALPLQQAQGQDAAGRDAGIDRNLIQDSSVPNTALPTSAPMTSCATIPKQPLLCRLGVNADKSQCGRLQSGTPKR